MRSILQKVLNKEETAFSTIVYPRDLYKLTETLYTENPWASSRPSAGHRYLLGSNAFEMFTELFFDQKKSDNYVAIKGLYNGQRTTKWVKRAYIEVPDNFEYYKLFIPKAIGSGSFGEALPAEMMGGIQEGCTASFVEVGKFSSYEESVNAVLYMKTKFHRALLGTLKVTQDVTKDKWNNVPLQDFSENSDIDWSKSIAEIDQQLYKKYNLTQEEIDFIEKNVVPME